LQHRDKVEFAPCELDKVRAFESDERWSQGSPMSKYLQQRAAQRRRSVGLRT
jgi:hypothetical protein